VLGSGGDRRCEVVLRGDVPHGVVREDRVEDLSQPDGAHVPFEVAALRVQRAAQLQHGRRAVDEGELEVRLQV
jgi:hypothetical protein